MTGADYLIMESTYGDRQHENSDPLDKLADIINRTAACGGVVAVPAFAVGRAKHLMYSIHLPKSRGAIRQISVFLDSPMAGNVTKIYHRHRSEHRLSPEECDANHIKAFAPDRRNAILFAVHQAGGTRGAKILAGDSSVRIHGEDVPVGGRGGPYR